MSAQTPSLEASPPPPPPPPPPAPNSTGTLPPPPPPAPRRSSTPPEALLRRIDWDVVGRLEGRLQGNYRSGALGEGLDVADLRTYEVDDDVRRIDWNVTARMDEPYVRQYDEDREITAWFVVDRSASMEFGHNERTKELVAAEIVAALARVFTLGGNRIGAVLWNNGVTQVIEPRSDRTHLLHVVSQLLSDPSGPNPTEQSPAAGLGDLLLAGAAAARRRSMVFVVSDFLAPPGWETNMRRLAARHDVVAIRVVDSQEQELPDAGFVVVQDAETGEQMTIDTSDQRFRERFAEASRQREAELRQATIRSGVELFPISTDADLVSALVSMAAQRKSRVRR